MSDRAVSTVLDVTLAMVLVSAAVLTLVDVPATPTADVGSDSADATASIVAGATARVNYSLSPGARKADQSLVRFPGNARSGPEFRRRAHGTLADLLARAAVGNAALEGQQLSHATDQFENRVASAAMRAVHDADVGVQVRAVWRPFPGSPLRGRVVAGSDPPLDARVHTATTNVSSGLPAARQRAVGAADHGYDAVARVVANATVRGLFPPERTRLALRGDYPLRALVRYRYLHASTLFGAGIEGIDGDRTRRANRKLAAALAKRFERRLRARYPTPEAAARNATVGTVVVVVRTWSR